MEGVEEAGGEGVSSSIGAFDFRWGNGSGLVVDFSRGGEGYRLAGGVEGDTTMDAVGEDLFCCGRDIGNGVRIDGSIEDGGGFDFVEEEVIGVGERGENDVFEIRVSGGDEIDGIHESGGAGAAQEMRGVGLAVRGKGIEVVEEEKVAEVEDAGVGLREVDVFPSEKGIGSALVEEGAAAGAGDGHDICVRGGVILGMAEVGGANVVSLEVVEYPSAVRIGADESGGVEGVGDLHEGKIL